MIKLILKHPKISITEKLYLLYKYVLCYWVDCVLYRIDKAIYRKKRGGIDNLITLSTIKVKELHKNGYK
jgi:hypothetical protein